MAYKVFTNGSTLQASELNENLMQQATAVFSNAAARTSAITSPVEGQMTYLEDTNRYGMWNGSAWVSPFGMTQLINSNVTASSSFAIDNVFTSEFENYKIIVRADDASAGNSVQLQMRFRKAGSTVTASNYRYASFFTNMASDSYGTFSRSLGTGLIAISQIGGDPSAIGNTSIDVYSPQISTLHTGVTFNSYAPYATDNAVSLYGSGSYAANDTFDGVVFAPGAGNFTGNIKIYGYRN